jgi:hypothetical protein
VSDPNVLFKQRLPQGYTLDLIDGGHGQFFSGRHIGSLGNVLTKCLAGATRAKSD